MGGFAGYMITARPELKVRLQGQVDPKCIKIFTDPIFIFAGMSGTSFTEEELARRKLIILARYRELAGMSDDEAVRLLGDAGISLELFDRLWDGEYRTSRDSLY